MDIHLLIVVQALAHRIQWTNADGMTRSGDPYIRMFLRDGVLLPGQSISETLNFERDSHAPPPSYSIRLRSGQGNP